MTNNPLNTSVLFLIFNRPETTEKVFEIIRSVKPPKLFVSADGPRAGKQGEKEKCDETRKIIERVDWDCDVKKNFSDENLGCKKAVAKGINWFFENVDSGIIIEDDCMVDTTFFYFAQELLSHYKDDERIMHIGAGNFQDGNMRGNASYYFSKLCHVWGWATWRRAWKNYDVAIKSLDEFKSQNLIQNIFEDKKIQNHWLKLFQSVYDNKIDTWDFQWVYTIWKQNGLSVIPNQNLVSNIGFGEDATFTKYSKSELSEMRTGKVEDIVHPEFIIPNLEADKYTMYNKVMMSKIQKVRTKFGI